jgi:transposase-like protein
MVDQHRKVTRVSSQCELSAATLRAWRRIWHNTSGWRSFQNGYSIASGRKHAGTDALDHGAQLSSQLLAAKKDAA